MSDTDPIPLTQALALPPFPVGALPGPYKEMVDAVAEATQTDPAMAATSALSAVAACNGGHAEIEIRSGWREPLNQYFVTIAAPGERKSAVQATMVAPLLSAERDLVERAVGDRLQAETRKEVATKRSDRLRKAAAGEGAADSAMDDAIAAAMFAEAIEVPPPPRLVADDITAEAVASMLADQGGRLAIISAEGGPLDIMAGRYSKLPNMDVWLKGHSGDMLKVDRKGRPPEYVRHPALTLGLMIQPAVLTEIANNRQFRGRGLLARILYAYPDSKVGYRKIGAQPVPLAVEEAYRTAVKSLAGGMVGWVGDPAILVLCEGAEKALLEIEKVVEPTLAKDGELGQLADWGGKFVGEVARLAGNLHLAEYGPDQGPRHPVSEKTVLDAARIGDYFKVAAINAFMELGTDHATVDAVYLLGRIEHLAMDEVSERDLFTAASRGRFRTVASMGPALDRLIDHGYLVPITDTKPTGGRPASPRYTVVAAKAAQHAKA